MGRPRRTDRESWAIPLAAEVLELRSLLSSAAAAAGHAVSAAHQAESHHARTATAAGFSYNGPISGTMDVPAFALSHSFAGTLAVSTKSLQAGSAFKGTLTTSAIGNVGAFSIGPLKGSLSGKITSVVPNGNNRVITIAPTKSDSLTTTVTFSGLSAKPKLTLTSSLVVTIDSQGHIVSVAGTYHIPTVQPIFQGGDATFTFTST